MSPLQFTLRHLLVAVAFVAVGCAALLNANGWWVSGIWTCVVALLSLAALLAIFLRGQRQAFWIGFALVGWLTVLAATDKVPALTAARQLPQQLTGWLYQRLPEIRRARYIEEQTGRPVLDTPPPYFRDNLYAPPSQTALAIKSLALSQQPTFASNPQLIHAEDFLSIGDALWTLILAYSGGCIALWLYCREQHGAKLAG